MALTDNDIVNYLRRSQQYASDRAELIVDAIEEGRDIPYDVAQECVNILYLNYGINHAKPGLSDFELEKLIEHANAYYGLNDIAAVVADPYETSIKLLGADTPPAITDEEVLAIVEEVVAKIDLADRLIDDSAAFNNKTYSSSKIEELLALKANVEDLPDSEFTQEYKDDVEANTVFRENFTHQSLDHLIPKIQKGAINGVTPLNSKRIIDLKYIDPSIKQAEYLIGGWDASTNTPTIPPASPDNRGGYYVVTVAGNTTIDGYSNWLVNERIISNGSTWFKGPSQVGITGIKGNAESEFTSSGNKTMDPDDFDDSAANNKFVTQGQKDKINNTPADTNAEIDEIRALASPDFIAVETIAARDAIATENRDWGMYVRVAGSTNLTYELREDYVDSDISNNENWRQVPDAGSVQTQLDNTTLDDVAENGNVLQRDINFNQKNATKVTKITFGNNAYQLSTDGAVLKIYKITSGGGLAPKFQVYNTGIAFTSGLIVDTIVGILDGANPSNKRLTTEKGVVDYVAANAGGATAAGTTGEIQYKGGNGNLAANPQTKYHITEKAWTIGYRTGGVGIGSVVTGGNALNPNEASNDFARASGVGCKATGQASEADGQFCEALADYSSATGFLAVSYLRGQRSRASGKFAVAGDAQNSLNLLIATTTDGNVTEMLINEPSDRLVLPDDTNWAFTLTVNARRIDIKSEDAHYEIKGLIKRNTGAGSTVLKGVVKKVISEDVIAWNVDVSEDTVAGALKVEVTGEAGKNIQWMAKFDFVENKG